MKKKKTSKFQKITNVAVWLMVIVTISGIVLSVLATFSN